MKIVLVSLIVAVVVACANGEKCTTNDNCTATVCGNGFHVICEHPDGGVTTGGGLCTCAKDDITCANRSDCVMNSYKCISDDHKHCYDGKCICSRW